MKIIVFVSLSRRRSIVFDLAPVATQTQEKKTFEKLSIWSFEIAVFCE